MINTIPVDDLLQKHEDQHAFIKTNDNHVKLKDFKVLKVIGVGSFGKVYLVKLEE